MSSTSTVDFGDLDVTFSAPFYTGVFLSSRELQGTYESHQNIVIREMQENLQWGWSPPPDVPEFWNRTVSPSHFIGTEINDSSSGLIKAISCLICFSSMCQNCWFKYASSKIQIIVKFFEFGFGSVSIRLREFSRCQVAVSSAEDLKKFLLNCEEVIRPILNNIANSASKEYRKSVPCCIKNSDIWDIDNFAGLESSEAMCRVGKVQEISTMVVLEGKCCKDIEKLQNEFKNIFLCFSDELHKVPLNAACRLFSDGESITIALGGQNNEDELNDLFDITEMAGVFLATGKYFNNFFCSYFNYVSSEYEIIASKSLYRVANVKNLKNLIEKFLDIEALYSQLCLRMPQHNNSDNSYKIKLHNLSPRFLSVKRVWKNLDKSFYKLKDEHETINKVKSQNSFLANLDVAYLAVILSAISIAISIMVHTFSELDDNISDTFLFIFGICMLIILISVALVINVESVINRKLYYICGVQKEKYKDMVSDQEKRNKDRFNCTCNVSACHRCRGDKWHCRVFYREENLCFRCGKTHKV